MAEALWAVCIYSRFSRCDSTLPYHLHASPLRLRLFQAPLSPCFSCPAPTMISRRFDTSRLSPPGALPPPPSISFPVRFLFCVYLQVCRCSFYCDPLYCPSLLSAHAFRSQESSFVAESDCHSMLLFFFSAMI